MRRFFMAAGLLLSGSLAATAQTMDDCADIGINPTPQLNGACDTGGSGGSIGNGTTSTGPGASAPLVVPNDPAGQSGSIDRGTTSSIPAMPPLVVPNTGNRNGLSSEGSTLGSRSGAIPSPGID
jgi:hypothetical protein